MDVFGGNEGHIDFINFATDFYVTFHARWSDDEVCAACKTFGFKQTRAAWDAEFFEGGGNGEADGFVGAGFVGDEEAGRQGVETSIDAFDGGIEGF